MDPPNEATVREEWQYWRGSPGLLAQVANAAIRGVRDGDTMPSCRIDVEVDQDHEVFESPSEFTAGVTREALRNFRSIRIDVRGDLLKVCVILAWRRPWWAFPGRSNEKDAQVVLEVAGADEAAVKGAFASIRHSIKRGGREGKANASVRQVLYWATLLGVTAATASALYLLKLSDASMGAYLATTFVVGLGAAIIVGFWVFPMIEVAPPGHTRLWRLVKFLGPAVVTVIVAGIAKLLYG
jgi:hypothetical protein